LFEYERMSVIAVFQSSVPRGSFHELLIRVDATAPHLNRPDYNLNYILQINKDDKCKDFA